MPLLGVLFNSRVPVPLPANAPLVHAPVGLDESRDADPEVDVAAVPKLESWTCLTSACMLCFFCNRELASIEVACA